jgi:hypothetical protein
MEIKFDKSNSATTGLVSPNREREREREREMSEITMQLDGHSKGG